MLTPTMETAVARLRASFDPEEIILFGSRAYGTPRPDSDMDLLIVLRPTTEAMAARERRMREALGLDGWRSVDGHVWAYTAAEVREQLQRGSVSVRDALQKGTRLYPEGGRSRYAGWAREWSGTGAKETLLQKAHGDLLTAERMLQPPVVSWVVAFHAQQAAEKALKGLIYHLGGEPARTHSLGDLALKASELDHTAGQRVFLKYQAAMAELERHAVEPRYLDAPPVGEAEARAAVETARAVLVEVSTVLNAQRSHP